MLYATTDGAFMGPQSTKGFLIAYPTQRQRSCGRRIGPPARLATYKTRERNLHYGEYCLNHFRLNHDGMSSDSNRLSVSRRDSLNQDFLFGRPGACRVANPRP